MEKITAEIKSFCEVAANEELWIKYSKFFKSGYDAHGISKKDFKKQLNTWMREWNGKLDIYDYLEIGDRLVAGGKFEEVGFAIQFIAHQRDMYTPEIFDKIGKWLENGISNWANTDVLCMHVIKFFLLDKVVGFEELKKWTASSSLWKRRAVPVTLFELVKSYPVDSMAIFECIDDIMLDDEQDVQKGIGTLLRELWKIERIKVEDYLMKYKDTCGRIIIRYATEKMAKEERVRFRRSKP